MFVVVVVVVVVDDDDDDEILRTKRSTIIVLQAACCSQSKPFVHFFVETSHDMTCCNILTDYWPFVRFNFQPSGITCHD